MPVDMLCPHTGQMFTPKFVTTSSGHKVAAPIQVSPGDASKKMVSSFGVASGQAQATAEMPLARNSSEKFDLGRNFANKLWNAVRFALSNLEGGESKVQSPKSKVELAALSLADRWILARLTQTIEQTDAALKNYDFKGYADGLYDFIWRDLCDWYVEAIKPTLKGDAGQQAVLAGVLDATLRLLHPAMPFITEALWTRLNEVCPTRGLPGLALPGSELLCRAAWPQATGALRDDAAVAQFDLMREVVGSFRAVRTQYKVPPRQAVDGSIAAPAAVAQQLAAQRDMIQTLAMVTLQGLGADVAKPANAAVAVLGECQLYLHGLVDADAEKTRLAKRIDEVAKSVAQLTGRLGNASYIQKAPAHLVEQTKQQLADAQRELDTLKGQLASL
jgi:valyl-tRNA synthetase